MKKLLMIMMLAVSVPTTAGTLTLEWGEPTTSYNDTSLSYDIRWGISGVEGSDSIVSASGNSHTIDVGDEPATYYAQIRTIETHPDGDILRSVWSPVVTAEAIEEEKTAPDAPTLIIRFELGTGLSQ